MLGKQAPSLLTPPISPSSPRPKEVAHSTLLPSFDAVRASLRQSNMGTNNVNQPETGLVEDVGSEPLFQDDFIAPHAYSKSYQPSADLAAKWMDLIQDKINAEVVAAEDFDDSDDDDDDDEELPSYESVLATAVTLVAPGKPKVVDVSPPASIRSGFSRSTHKSARPNHSRSSSYFSEANSLSRPSSTYSNSDHSLDFAPDTPASSLSAPSFASPQWAKRSSFSFSPNTNLPPTPPPVPRRNPNRRRSDSQAQSCLIQPTHSTFETSFRMDSIKPLG